jgi:hypothetical protein
MEANHYRYAFQLCDLIHTSLFSLSVTLSDQRLSGLANSPPILTGSCDAVELLRAHWLDVCPSGPLCLPESRYSSAGDRC